jgi:D-serine deaminase-like pyridoxal phosphate-dependent protein
MCPVVAKYPARNELLIHGGAIHFSKEMWQIMGKEACFGVIDTEGLESAAYVKSISQEHGIVRCSNEFFATVNVGDLLPIFPIHSCLMAHQMGKYYTTFGVGCDHFSSDLIGD